MKESFEEYVKRIEKYDTKTLPKYLQISIKDYVQACKENNKLRMGDYYTDLVSSINIAQWDNELPMDKINELRDTF